MHDIKNELTGRKKLLVITAHPDDESYCFAGLIQIAKSAGLVVDILCLTAGNPHHPKSTDKPLRTAELNTAAALLGVDEVILKDLDATKMPSQKVRIKATLSETFKTRKYDCIATFDYSGITGHVDHIILGQELIKLLPNLKPKPKILLRVPDTREKRYFTDNKAMKHALSATHVAGYSFGQSIKKIRAILAHKSQIKNIYFKLHLLDWHLFDTYEYYHMVQLKK